MATNRNYCLLSATADPSFGGSIVYCLPVHYLHVPKFTFDDEKNFIHPFIVARYDVGAIAEANYLFCCSKL